MNSPAAWQNANTAFLEQLMLTLRDHLAAQAEPGPNAEFRWPRLPAETSPLPALFLLRDAFGLSEFETAVLALCAAHELDTGIGPLCAAASGDPARAWPTFGLALHLFPPAAWDSVTAEAPLRGWYLISLERRSGEPLALAPLRCDERILDFIKGLNSLDQRLGLLASAIPPPDGDTPDREASAVLGRLWGERMPPGTAAMLFGGDASLRSAVAAAASAHSGRRLFRIEAEALPSLPGDLDQFARLWNREAVLIPLALLIDAQGLDDGAAASLTRRFVSRLAFPVVLSADKPARWAEALLAIPVTRPGAVTQQAAWVAALGPAQTPLARRLAGAFDFSPATIARIAAAASPGAHEAAVWRSCVVSVRPRLDALAQRIEPRAAWDDLVLPEDQRGLLRQIVDQVRQRRQVYEEWGYAARMSRGLGINALFTGESGTGKTMAAEVVAGELELNLYRIDLSAVVSKYIGETEKNLGQLFDAAEQGGAVLLFDEADALFGKRSEVKDSHDRYANIEINYLLQRIESFAGLAILATNLKAALDTAFMRRLRFIVRFPHPGPAERRQMWQRVFPAQLPLATLDYERLSRINLTGGHIVAAALNAAFLAAAENQPVGMRHVLQTARAELVKLNRPITESDFVAPPVTALASAAE
jgi:AAA+ superfamily predicted ATPase